MCDANYNFIRVDIGTYERNADGSVFASSELGRIILPYCIVSYAAFPLKQNLMRPYPGRNLPHVYENSNYRLSIARRIAENVFGIVAALFKSTKLRQNTATLVITPKQPLFY